jgi:hypothetical protein
MTFIQDLVLVLGPPPALIFTGLFPVRGSLGGSLAENPVLVLGVPSAAIFPGPFRIGGPPPALGFPGRFWVGGSALTGVFVNTFHARMVAHGAFRDVATLARLAGEEALQAKRHSFFAADDGRGFGSHGPAFSGLWSGRRGAEPLRRPLVTHWSR